MNKIWVISLGGSLIAPGEISLEFLSDFCTRIRQILMDFPEDIRNANTKIVIICGGGSLARKYQTAYQALAEEPKDERTDWIGIAATKLNAELIRQLLIDITPEKVVTNPSEINSFSGKVLVAAGWKPGFSHDYGAVILAERLNASEIIKLSSSNQIYNSDPIINPKAKSYKKMKWHDLQKLTGNHWTPGFHSPFDPIATKKASEQKIRLIVAGKNMENFQNIIEGREFIGTTVGPD